MALSFACPVVLALNKEGLGEERASSVLMTTNTVQKTRNQKCEKALAHPEGQLTQRNGVKNRTGMVMMVEHT
jgi:hypothetical protein